MADRTTTDRIAVIFSGGPAAGRVMRLAGAPALFLADIGPGLPPRVSLMPLHEDVIITTADGIELGGKRPSYRRTDRRDARGALVYQWEGADEAPAEIPLAADIESTALARGAAVLCGGPAAGVEISLAGTIRPPAYLLATVAPDFLEVVPADDGDLRAGRACYYRTERRDARGFAVYEWDGVAAAAPGPGPDAAKAAESGSWRDRPAML